MKIFRIKRSKLFIVFALVIGLVVMWYAAAAVSGGSPTDLDLFFRGGSSTKTLDELVQRAAERGVVVKDSGVSEQEDGQTVYQLVLDCPPERAALAAQWVWHEAALMGAEGNEMPPVEVLVFDKDKKLTFGGAVFPQELQDVTRGKPVVPLADARKQLQSVVDGIVQTADANNLPAGFAVHADVTEDGRGDRSASIVVDFPAAASFDQVDSIVRPLHETVGDLNLRTGAAVTFASLVVSRGGEKLLEESQDFQTGSIDGWHGGGYMPPWISVPDTAPTTAP